MIAALVLATMAVATTDQTVPVTRGTKLSVNNFAGDVNIKVWDKDSVRVEVNHSDRETVDIKQADQTVSVRSRSVRGGPPRSLDYTITVPAWMAIGVNGTYADVTAEGVGGDVTVETTHGDITIRGGSGFISLKSVQGAITLERAKGRVEVRAINEGIHLADISADLSAESTNGSIILDRIDSSNVDLYTVNGNVSYDGPIKDKGLYRLTTHNGMIAMPVAERANVTLTARTYNGSVRSTFPLPGDDSERRAKRISLTIGNGSAHVELESFSGTIALRRPGEARPEIERRRRDRGRDDDNKAKGNLPAPPPAPPAPSAVPAPPALPAPPVAPAPPAPPAPPVPPIPRLEGREAAMAEAMAAVQAAIPDAMAAAQAAIPDAMAAAHAAIPDAMAAAQAAIPDAMAAVPQALDEALAAMRNALREAMPQPRPWPR